MRSCVLFLAVLISCASAHAAPATPAAKTCQTLHFKSPVEGSIKFGMKKAEAEAALKKAYKTAIGRSLDETRTKFVIPNHKTLDGIILEYTLGVVTKIVASYSNQFQDQLGGHGPASVTLLKQLIAKYGDPDSNEPFNNDKAIKVFWKKNGQVMFLVVNEDGRVLFLISECDELKVDLTENAGKQANFGI